MEEMLEGYLKDIYKYNLYQFLKRFLSYEKVDMEQQLIFLRLLIYSLIIPS